MLTDRRTDDGRKVITIAHPEQSSGELKILCGYPLLSVAMITVSKMSCVYFKHQEINCIKIIFQNLLTQLITFI